MTVAVRPVEAHAPEPQHSLPYMPQLDGVRALAVAAVMLHHYWIWKVDEPLGTWGVKLFFVLSGYLITRILLRSRAQIAAGHLDLGAAAKTFYIRRTLRIFPLYYVVLLVGAVVGVAAARDGFLWFATSSAPSARLSRHAKVNAYSATPFQRCSRSRIAWRGRARHAALR